MLLVIASVDEGRPGVGVRAVPCGDSVSVPAMSVRLERSPMTGFGWFGGFMLQSLRRCNSRAVDDWVGEVTKAFFEEGRRPGE